ANKGRQNAEPEQSAPSNCIKQQPVGDTRKGKAKTPRPLQDAAHESTRASRPGLHSESRPGRPFGTHADAKDRPHHEQEGEGWRKAGDEIADRIPENRQHKGYLAADRVGEPPGRDRPYEPQPKR